MNVLISGATGLIGKALTHALIQGAIKNKIEHVGVITRDLSSMSKTFEIETKTQLHQFEGDLSINVIEGLESICHWDVVVHLAGESIAQVRWTEKIKKRIYLSRIKGTENLLTSLQRAPSLFISSSAVGIYGNRADEILHEESSLGKGFLSQVCRDWEKTAKVFVEKKFGQNTRCVQFRSGMVLSPQGGALGKMLPIFKKGLGAPLGNGKQWISWIHIYDLVQMILFSIHDNNIQGPVNAVSPYPCRNKDLTLILCEVLQKSHLPSAPGFVLKLLLGEMSQILLDSQRVSSKKIQSSGFQFKFKDLKMALQDLILSKA